MKHNQTHTSDEVPYVLQNQKMNRRWLSRKNKLIYIGVLAAVLCVALFVVSMPLIYVCNAEKINTVVLKGVEKMVFPLDQEDLSDNLIDKDSLLFNWVEWEFTEEFFIAIGVGSDQSLIDQMKAELSSNPEDEGLQISVAVLEKLYDYYVRHSEPDTPSIESSTIDSTIEETESDSDMSKIIVDKQGVQYQLNSDGESYTVLGRSREDENYTKYLELVILEQIDGIPVTKLANNAFNFDHLTNIQLPQGLIEIGENALSCQNLTSIILPDTVAIIEKYAFAFSGLESISIPQGITAIQEGAFTHCLNLQTVVLPEGIVEIGDEAFMCCNALKTINLPDSLQTIRYRAFYDCQDLRTLELPAGLTSIGEGAFMISGIERIVIPQGVHAIPKQAFYLMNAFEIYLPDTLTKIETEAFGGRMRACKVYYQGTVSEWEEISKHAKTFDKVTDDFVIVCTDGEIVIQ